MEQRNPGKIGPGLTLRYNDLRGRVDRADLRDQEGIQVRRCGMEVTMAGNEIHALRGLIEETVSKLEMDIAGAKDQRTRETLVENKKVYKSILDKLPVEFETIA